ncbi:hypothetical protein SAMN05216251_11836 [Actinacidiphila alni]|uniref:Uncharacterized protein n=1 Tax=Actinacidiphila alni TaxID=380248 RepID=A0A1I2JN75_9ACTN|nr:hypothetical protein SAMN05216251_11836 [Actinacidiphila alni]
MKRKTVGRELRTQGRRGRVRVEEDKHGHQWVTCSGCKLDRLTPGIAPAKFVQRDHAKTCMR